MGRLILAVLLATILTVISHMSTNPNYPQCLSVIVYHLCSTPSLLPSRREQGSGVEGHWVNKGRAKPLKLQQVDCHWGEVLIESRPRLSGAAMSVSDHTLDVLLDHLRD